MPEQQQTTETVNTDLTNVLAYGESAPVAQPPKADSVVEDSAPAIVETASDEKQTSTKASFDEDIERFIKSAETTEKPEAKPSSTEPSVGSMFDILASKVTSDDYKYEVPEPIRTGKKQDGSPVTQEEAFDLLAYEIARHWDYTKQFDSDPFLSKYFDEMNKPGFDRQRFLDSYVNVGNQLQLSNKDLVIKDYMDRRGKSESNPGGYTEEQIREYVEKMNPLELDERAEGLRAEIAGRVSGSPDDELTPEQRSVIDRRRVIEDVRIIDEMLQSKVDVEEIFGIPYGEAIKKDFNSFFKYMMTYNPDIQEKPFLRLIQDDEQIFQMMFAYYNLVSGNIKDFVETMKESVKANMFDKLDAGPRAKRQGTSATMRVPTSDSFV